MPLFQVGAPYLPGGGGFSVGWGRRWVSGVAIASMWGRVWSWMVAVSCSQRCGWSKLAGWAAGLAVWVADQACVNLACSLLFV